MRESWVSRRRVLAAALGAAALTSFAPARWAAAVFDKPRHVLEAVVSPPVHGLKLLCDALVQPGDLAYTSQRPDDLRANLEEALRYNERLRQELAEARAQIAQLSRVREHMDLQGVELVWASVTGWSNDGDYPLLRLNRGAAVGLRPRQVVASGFNLVGRVVDVGPATATVHLLTAPRTHLAARLVPPFPGDPPRAVLADVHSTDDGDTFQAVVDTAEPVAVGDLAHLADDAWPPEARGLVIGKVTAVRDDPEDPTLRRRVTIQPIRPLAYLDRVVVMMPAHHDQGLTPTGGGSS